MKNIKDCLTITPQNISKYGFAAFHYKDEPNLENDFWERDLEVEVSLESENQIQKFRIPKRLLIQLSKGDKIVHSENYGISTMSSSLETIRLLSERAGWNQTDEDIRAMLSLSKQSVFISTYRQQNQKIALGSGVALPINYNLCWIGMILVHPELRRQGIANSMMRVCMNHARLKENKPIIGLDATPQGKQVYDLLGFKDSFTIWRSVIATNCLKKKSSLDFKFSSETNLIKEYLTRLNYTERTGIIDLLRQLPGSECAIAKSEGKVLGFALSRPGRLRPFIGPLIADTKDVAFNLMSVILSKWNDRGHSHVFMDIPFFHLSESLFFNKENPEILQNLQIPVKPARTLIRMYQLVSKKDKIRGLTIHESKETQLSMSKAVNSHDETLEFMLKERQDILPFMYGTGGPEWS